MLTQRDSVWWAQHYRMTMKTQGVNWGNTFWKIIDRKTKQWEKSGWGYDLKQKEKEVPCRDWQLYEMGKQPEGTLGQSINRSRLAYCCSPGGLI